MGSEAGREPGVTRRRALCAAAALGLTASPAWSQGRPPRVLMVLWRGKTAVEAGFHAELSALGLAPDFVVIDADQSRGRLEEQLDRAGIGAGQYAAVYAFGTTAAVTARRRAPATLPVVYANVLDPVAAGLARPGLAATGSTAGVSIADQLDALAAFVPMRSLLLPFNPREPNSDLAERQTRAWCAQRGVVLETRRVAPDTDALATLYREIANGALAPSALYSGSNSYLSASAADVAAALGGRLPLLGNSPTYVAANWLATFAPSDDAMGRAAARLLAQVLAGADPAALPPVAPAPQLFVSRAAAAKLRLEPPAGADLI